MNPALSVVFFTTLAGAGQGLLLALVAAEWSARHGWIAMPLAPGFAAAGALLLRAMPEFDLEGRVVEPNGNDVNPAGFTIHSCIHQVREDAGCVLHTHSRAGVAVSAQKCGVLPISQQSTFVLASLAYHDYEGVALLEDEKPRLLRDLGDKNMLMLRNHGLLTVGRSVAEAFLAMYIFEAACMVQVRAQAGGGELRHIPDNILAMASAQMAQVTLGMGGALAWPALLRKLERKNPGYQD